MSLDTANAGAEDPEAATDSKKARVWRAELNDNYCKLRKLDHPPVGYDANGKLAFAKDAVSSPESYILWDTSRDAPPGFGLKVAGKKTYILRRKVMGKSMLAKVGNFADFEKIQTARAKAAELALAMVATGQNPNVMARVSVSSKLTRPVS
jgi:hypothetical protein